MHESNRCIGMGYLMRDVGEPLNPDKCKQQKGLLKKIILSLQGLHLRRIFHGDARVFNGIIKEDGIVVVRLIENILLN